jgi:chromosome segregation ATPase
MKNLSNLMHLSFTLLLATLFMCCQSPSEKVENAEEDVDEAKEDLREAQQDAATEQEWAMFKSENEIIIKYNEDRINELKAKKRKTSNSAADKAYAERIDALEQRNRELKNRIDNYETNRSDWEAFKREFKHDMDAIAEGFSELGRDNEN